MLNDTDIHYLVGLLTSIPEGTDVTIELGDMVYDKAGKKKRDVDITITKLAKDGTRSAYKGMEVKNHRRPLDITQVEQLCLKLKDMPDITNRAIVSASGYTASAINKAKSHGVDLLEIVDWNNPHEGFNVKFEIDNSFTLVEHAWVDGPHVRINVSEADNPYLTKEFDKALKVVTYVGNPYPDGATLGELSDKAHTAVGLKAQEATGPQTDLTKPISVEVRVNFKKTPFIKLHNRLIRIEEVLVTGSLGYVVHDKPVFKILRQLGAPKPLTGCLIHEMKNHSLMGISVSNLDNHITHLNIPYADRIKTKIRNHVIAGSSSAPKAT